MYEALIKIVPAKPDRVLKSLTIGKNSFVFLKFLGMPDTASSVTVALTPVGGGTVIKVVSLMPTSEAIISCDLFGTVGAAQYEIYFTQAGRSFWCGRGDYEVVASSITEGQVHDGSVDSFVYDTVDVTLDVDTMDLTFDVDRYRLMSIFLLAPVESTTNISVSNLKSTLTGATVYLSAKTDYVGYTLNYTLVRL